MISFGKNIQNRRVALGLDVSELAQLANYANKSYIERIEDEKMYPSAKKLPDLAKALSWKVDDLFKSLIQNAIRFIKSMDKKEVSLKTVALSIDTYKKYYACLFDKYIRENFLNKVKEMILKTYYNNNPNLEKLTELFEEKEYEICLVGVIKILEDIVENRSDKREEQSLETNGSLKEKEIEIEERNIEIDEEDFLRI